jgi:hypothetical protein
MWLPSTVDEINYLTGQVYRRTDSPIAQERRRDPMGAG